MVNSIMVTIKGNGVSDRCLSISLIQFHRCHWILIAVVSKLVSCLLSSN